MDNMFRINKRCDSVFYSPDPDDLTKLWRQIQCIHQKNHNGMHSGYASIPIMWNNPDSAISKMRWENRSPVKIDAELFGWRCWKLQAGLLYSLTAKYAWRGPVARTKDNKPPSLYNTVESGQQLPPNKDYGVYSYKTAELARKYLSTGSYPVFGRVKLIGRVIEHDLGYRSQGVVISELWVNTQSTTFAYTPNAYSPDKIVKELEERYQCDVHSTSYPFSPKED